MTLRVLSRPWLAWAALLALLCWPVLVAAAGQLRRAGGCERAAGRRLLAAGGSAVPQSSPSGADCTGADCAAGASSLQTLPLDTVQQDCIVFQNRYYDVAAISNADELVSPSSNLQPKDTDCCRSCHATTNCSMWQWCPVPSGCSIRGVEVVFPYRGCQLLLVAGFSPYTQGNLTSVSGAGVPFTAGGAVDLVMVQVPGYDLEVGADFGGKYDYACAGSVREGTCMLQGTVQAVAAACTSDANCLGFVYFPDGIDFVGSPTGMLKGGPHVSVLSQSDTQLNPSGGAYFKTGSGSPVLTNGSSTATNGSTGAAASSGGGGSDTAAIVGGVVGGVVGLLVLLALAGWFYRRRRLAAAAPGPKAAEAGAQPPLNGSEDSGVSGGAELSGPPGPGPRAPNASSKGPWPAAQLRRSDSPPSVVDAHLDGLLGSNPEVRADGLPTALEGGGSSGGSGSAAAGQRLGLGLEDTSPFAMIDAATLAAMQAAAPGLVQLPTAAAAAAGFSSLSAPASSGGSGFTPQGSFVQALRSDTTVGTATTSTGVGGSLSLPPQYIPPFSPLQLAAAQQQAAAAAGWGGQEVVVAEVSARRVASTLSSPPASLAQGSTARELLEAFAKLYRQRPEVDYTALEGMQDLDATAPIGSGEPSAGPSVSPQSLTLQTTLLPGGASALPQLPLPPPPPSASPAQERLRRLDAGPSRTASGLLVDPSSSMALPEMPWSDWALRPEEVEICRRPDGSWWQLGSGACGTVYKGLYHGVQPVAVKVLHQREDGRRTDVFMREVTMLKGLRDRNIVQFLGASLDGPNAMLVTEFMELGDLWRALPIVNHAGDRVFSWYRRGWRVALDVARGLHFLHCKRTVHLDLKSANILLSRHGTAKIADIGMARVLNRDYLTVLSGLGTFAWSAPEVLAGKRCSEKVDIYSFGVVVWEIATGEVPIRGDMRPLVAPADCPASVVELHARCTAENPEERPTAMEIVEVLSALSPRGSGSA